MLLPDGTYLVWYFVFMLVGWDMHILERGRTGPIVGYVNCDKMVQAYEEHVLRSGRGVPVARCDYKMLTMEQLRNGGR